MRCAECVSGNVRGAPGGAQTPVRLARPNGDGLRREDGRFGLQKDVEPLVRLRGQLAIFADPARQEGRAGFLNPLLEQCVDFFAQVGGVVQTRKLKAFQRRVRCLMQIVPRWGDAVAGHGLDLPWGAGPSMHRTINMTCNNVPSTLSRIYPRAVEIYTGRSLEPAGGGVCSGCSGDYAGDWEDPGELGADSGGSDCPLATGGKREPQGNWPSSERARHFEDSADSECDSRWASLPGERGQSAGE